MQLIECVPNFSEGNNMEVISRITESVESVEGVTLLNVDPGKATNRTVVTFVGTPDAVVEAAFRAIKTASALIDMSRHKGEHPRMGATDVCPLVPIRGISMEETAEYARKLAKRVGEELNIPVYLYEAAALVHGRTNLSDIRAGEYEGFFEKIKLPAWRPDFGPAEMNKTAGATVIGAREFLIAYNVNLNTTSVRRANSVAFDLRERGRILREGDPVSGKIVRDGNGEPVYVPGALKSVKAIGWFIREYGIAQVSMNLTNINITPLHIAFDEACNKAQQRGIRVTGSELVGLIPLNSMLEAGRYFLKKQKRSAGVPDSELIKIAVKSLGLDEPGPFNPRERIIEYLLEDKLPLGSMSLKEFSEELSTESPAPGGGSVAAFLGSIGVALAAMVANLSAAKRGWDNRWEEFSDYAERAQKLRMDLLRMVDEDTAAFNRIMEAFKLPKNNEDEKLRRAKAITEATRYAIEVPLRVMELSLESLEVIRAMVHKGNPNSVSDAGVGIICASSAAKGAWLNVKINCTGFEDRSFAEKALSRGREIVNAMQLAESELLVYVEKKIDEAQL